MVWLGKTSKDAQRKSSQGWQVGVVWYSKMFSLTQLLFTLVTRQAQSFLKGKSQTCDEGPALEHPEWGSWDLASWCPVSSPLHFSMAKPPRQQEPGQGFSALPPVTVTSIQFLSLNSMKDHCFTKIIIPPLELSLLKYHRWLLLHAAPRRAMSVISRMHRACWDESVNSTQPNTKTNFQVLIWDCMQQICLLAFYSRSQRS